MENKRNLGLIAIVFMMFIAIFGFSNIPLNYLEFGSSIIPLWLIITVIYFIPLVLMMGELATYNENKTGGLYNWIISGLNEKWAFIGVWSFFVANIFYIATLGSRIPVLVSYTLIGSSTLDQNVILFAVLSIASIGIATILATYTERFFNRFSTFIGGLSLFVTILFFVLAAGVIIFQLQPVDFNPQSMFQLEETFSPMMLTSLAWLLFAVAGAEAVGPYIANTKKPAKTYPKGVFIAAILIGLLYTIGSILLSLISSPDQFTSMANAIIDTYVIVGNLYDFGLLYVQLIGIAYLLITLFALTLWISSIAKTTFSELPKGTMPKWLTKTNSYNTPINSLKLLFILGTIFIIMQTLLVGTIADDLYYILYDMSTMALILPYIILVVAYIQFRRKKIVAPYQMIKNNNIAIFIGIVILILNILGFIFAGYTPEIPLNEQIISIILYYGGLVFFILIGIIIKKISK